MRDELDRSGVNSTLLLLVGAAIVFYLIFSGAQGNVPVDYGTGNTVNSYNSYHYETNNTSIDICAGYCP